MSKTQLQIRKRMRKLLVEKKSVNSEKLSKDRGSLKLEPKGPM